MNSDELRAYCMMKTGANEGFPFGDDVLVIKVASKMFAILAEEDGTPKISLKCDPEIALQLREEFSAVKPGYHLNKQHWNTVWVDGTIPDDRIKHMIDDSYLLVFKSLKRSEREDVSKMN